ncbi:DEAD/DEAH box helicase [Kiritimatiellaeota bacterium B1221]|nr:DEAD/DEAH box helicase [Kiritimatiellaeota bacterium B1221]
MTSSSTASKPSSSAHPESGKSDLQGSFKLLSADLQRCVSEAGYTQPTPIQEQSIGPIVEGQDLIGTAQTGTGKTAAFTLPILQRLSENPVKVHKGSPRVLVLAPTRELAAQIGESIETYGRFLSLKHAVIFGGVNQFHQVKQLNKGLDILVATPGRLLDLMSQGYIRLNKVEIFVLDEMDRMLDMGFIRDIKKVLVEVPSKRQTLFFSATMSHQIEQLAATMVRNPFRVSITPDKPTVERIDQKVLFIQPGNKNRSLVNLIKGNDVEKVIVFTQMKHAANKVVENLTDAGISAAAIHGNKSQAARIKALDGFKRGRFKVLVATDVAARGLDVDDISHVVNYDMPVEAETYVHRIGRTGRAGAEGDAISFVSPEDRAYLTQVEKLLGNAVPVDLEHEFHSDEARYSTLKPKVPGRGRSGGRGRSNNRNRTKPSNRRGRQMGGHRSGNRGK